MNEKIATICIILCITNFCYAQSDWKEVSDSMALVGRVKADTVLSKFDTTPGKKILYSLLNRDYYIIFQLDNYYKEYVVTIDSVCNVLAIKEVGNDKEIEKIEVKKVLSKNDRRLLKQLKENRQAINDAFNTNQYRRDLITALPNATYIAGVPSYFVLKDENHKRYGEYSLSSITTPYPIDPNLWVYLNKKISVTR